MNFLETIKIMNRMIDQTRSAKIYLEIIRISGRIKKQVPV